MQTKAQPAIVIYGGTFNPIHNGHIIPVIESAKSVNAQKLIYLPCHLPPHKQTPSVTSLDRLEMVKLALANTQTAPLEITVSDHEITNSLSNSSTNSSTNSLTNKTPSYTRLSIEYFHNFFHKTYPEHRLYFLIGMDSLFTFHLWFKWQEIFNFCDLLVMQRPNVNYDLSKLNDAVKPYLNNQITITSTTEVDVSSSQIKTSLAQPNSNFDDAFTHVPSVVVDYIRSHNLYK